MESRWNTLKFVIFVAAMINLVEYMERLFCYSSLQVSQQSQCGSEICRNYCIDQPYISWGPSKIEERIPLSILKEKIQFNSVNGLKYLDHTSLSRFYQCQSSKQIKYNSSIKWCSEREFMHGSSPLVALVSFHGSGNTWLRYLIEQASGIFSGSIYCDPGLRAMFPGESIASGNVIVIKTHHADTRALPKAMQLSIGREKYHKAIILVRNPFDALISEANRRWNSKQINSHIGLASETSFISNSRWDGLVDYKGVVWSFLLHTWLSQNDTEILVVQYEKLVSNTREELNKILAFLSVKISEERMDCVMKNKQGNFKRAEHLNFNPFSKENTEVMNRHMSQAIPLLENYNISYVLSEV